MSHRANEAIYRFQIDLEYQTGISERINGEDILTLDPPVAFKGVIQPAGQAAMKLLPEGQRVDLSKILHTHTSLDFSAPGFGEKDTFIEYNNVRFKVFSPALWTEEKFNKYILLMVEKVR